MPLFTISSTNVVTLPNAAYTTVLAPITGSADDIALGTGVVAGAFVRPEVAFYAGLGFAATTNPSPLSASIVQVITLAGR